MAPVVTLPFLRLHPRRSPRGGLHGSCSPWARSSRPSASPPCRGVPGGGGPPHAFLIPLAPSPSPRCPRLCPWWVWEVGAGGGGRPRCPSSGAGTVLARGTALVLLLGCGARHVVLVFALPTLRAPPRCPPSWRGGAAARPSLPATPTLGGAEACGGGGGGLSFSFRCPRVAGTRRGPRPSAGGGGGLPRGSLRRPFYPTPAPPVVPPPGLARRAPSTGTVVWLVPHPPTSASPPCRVALGGGGGGLFAPPLPAFALGGAVVLGGGRGALFAFPPLHARRRHVVGTTQPRGEALGCCGGGGGFPCGLSRPAPLYRPRTPGSPAAVVPSAVVATSPHGAQCPVPAPSCAHTYWRRYVPGWIRKMKKCGQRGGLTVRLEGFLRHPLPWSRGGPLFRHPTARGGATAHPLPGACVSTSERPDTGAVVSVRWKWRLQSGRALSSPGPLPPPSAMEAPEVLWQRRGEAVGGFICGIPWPPS